MANTTDQTISSIHYSGYTYSVGDIIKVNTNYLYTSSWSGNSTTDSVYLICTYKIVQIYNQDYANWSTKYYPDYPIKLEVMSGDKSIIGTNGFCTLAMILEGSGGTPDTYTVSYNANGGSGAPSSQTKTYNKTLTLSSTKPTRSGYSFLGWSTSSSASSATYSAGGSYTANSGTTLYAVWKINTYTISYNANGGSGAPGTQTKTHGTNLTLSTTIPTRSGYIFKGWSTSSSSTTISYTAGGTYTNNSSVTLYAVWEKGYYLNLDVYVNNEKIKSDTHDMSLYNFISCNVYVNGIKLATNCQEYYAIHEVGSTYFVEYTCNDEYGKVYKTAYLEGSIYDSVDVGVYAGLRYELAYNANGGIESDEIQIIYYGNHFTSKGSIFTRYGFKLTGWNSASDGSGFTLPLNTEGVYSGQSDTTLYAMWERSIMQLPILMEDGTVIIGDVCSYVDGQWREALTISVYDEPSDTWREVVIPEEPEASNIIDEAIIGKSKTD